MAYQQGSCQGELVQRQLGGLEKFWKARLGGITCKHDSVCDQMQNEAWNKCSFVAACCFVPELQRQSYARHSGLQVNLTEQYPVSSF